MINSMIRILSLVCIISCGFVFAKVQAGEILAPHKPAKTIEKSEPEPATPEAPAEVTETEAPDSVPEPVVVKPADESIKLSNKTAREIDSLQPSEEKLESIRKIEEGLQELDEVLNLLMVRLEEASSRLEALEAEAGK